MCVPLLDVGEGCRCGASSVRPPNADGCEQRRRGCVATGAREDSELLLTLWVRSPVNAAGPRIRVATAGASGCLRRAGASRRSGSPRSRRAADVWYYGYILFRSRFVLSHVTGDGLVVCPQVEIRPASRRPGRPAAEQ